MTDYRSLPTLARHPGTTPAIHPRSDIFPIYPHLSTVFSPRQALAPSAPPSVRLATRGVCFRKGGRNNTARKQWITREMIEEMEERITPKHESTEKEECGNEPWTSEIILNQWPKHNCNNFLSSGLNIDNSTYTLTPRRHLAICRSVSLSIRKLVHSSYSM
jgi:hypothetical protein